MPTIIRTVAMSIDSVSGELKLNPDSKCLGAQYDMNATLICFVRPAEYENDELWLYWDGFSPISIGRKNEFLVKNYLMQDTGAILQVAFFRMGKMIKRSDTKIYFTVNDSLRPGNMTPDNIPDPVAELINRAVVGFSQSGNTVVGHNLAGSPVAEIFMSSGGGPLLYTHNQAEPADAWNIQHNLGGRPVTALTVDDTGEQIVGQVDALVTTSNLLVIRFSEPLSGKAYLKL